MMHEDELRGRMLAQSMWTELEKIAKDKDEPSKTDRALEALPGVGALAGGAAGAVDPKRFDPGWFKKGLKGTGAKGRVVSGLMGAGTGATIGWIPSALRDAKDALSSKKKTAEVIALDDGSPVAKIIGSSIEKLDDERAHGVPIVEPPPGFVYAPDLQAFIPNEDDPGWMTNPEAMAAEEKASAYQQGQMDTQQQSAQQEADTAAGQAMAEQQAAMMAQDQPMAPGQQPAAPGAAQVPQQGAPQPPAPKQITGLHPMAQPQGSNPPPTPPIQQPGPKSSTTVAR